MGGLEQRQFGEAPAIINPNEPHMALVFLLDTSYSMEGDPIRMLNEGLNRFKQDVCKDSQTKAILDVALIEFNSTHSVVQEFVPVEYMDNVNLVVNGATNMSKPIKEALAMVDERSRFYRRSGTEPYKPWILLLTDGAPSDNIDSVAQEIKSMEAAGKVSFRSLGVWANTSQAEKTRSMETLRKLSGEKVLELQGLDFTSFFDWVNKSMRSVSQSSPGERPQAVAVTGNVQIPDWD